MSKELESFNHFLHLATKHYERIARSEKIIKTSFLLDEEVFTDHSDIVASRFQQLQSILSEKILPSLLEQLGEDGVGYPFIEVFNRAIKLKIVNIEYSDWKSLRDERNRISHGEYEDLSFEEQKVIVKDFIREDVAMLKKLYVNIAKYILDSPIISSLITQENKDYVASTISPNKWDGGAHNAIKP